ncbi:MAG: fibronectin type III domain-containing protein [Patescibacteria group bacterium]
MEPKKEKKIKHLATYLAIGLVAAGVGGYIIYDIFYSTPETGVVTRDDAAASGLGKPLTFKIDDEVFSDARLYELAKEPFEGFNEQHQGIALNTRDPLAPTLESVTSTGAGRQLIVKWQLPAHINFSSVRLYRSEAKGKLGMLVYEEAISGMDSGRVMNYIDSDVVNEVQYYYLIRSVAVDEATGTEYESENGDQLFGIPADTIAPDSPLNVSVGSTGDGEITVSWINPYNTDFWFVRVYRSTVEGALGSVVYPRNENDIAEQAESYVDSVDPNTAYYYTVTSVDTSLNESSTDVLAAPYRINPFIPLP